MASEKFEFFLVLLLYACCYKSTLHRTLGIWNLASLYHINSYSMYTFLADYSVQFYI